MARIIPNDIHVPEHEWREILADLEEIVVTDGIDKGVVLLSIMGPTKFDPVQNCQVYQHKYFSPLGDALIELYHKLKRISDDRI